MRQRTHPSHSPHLAPGACAALRDVRPAVTSHDSANPTFIVAELDVSSRLILNKPSRRAVLLIIAAGVAFYHRCWDTTSQHLNGPTAMPQFRVSTQCFYSLLRPRFPKAFRVFPSPLNVVNMNLPWFDRDSEQVISAGKSSILADRFTHAAPPLTTCRATHVHALLQRAADALLSSSSHPVNDIRSRCAQTPWNDP